MNPYQIISGLLACGAVFCAFVTLLVWIGVPLPFAFLGVYLGAVWFMVGLQRRANESSPERQGKYSLAMHYDRSILRQKSVIYNRKVAVQGAAESTLSA